MASLIILDSIDGTPLEKPTRHLLHLGLVQSDSVKRMPHLPCLYSHPCLDHPKFFMPSCHHATMPLKPRLYPSD